MFALTHQVKQGNEERGRDGQVSTKHQADFSIEGEMCREEERRERDTQMPQDSRSCKKPREGGWPSEPV